MDRTGVDARAILRNNGRRGQPRRRLAGNVYTCCAGGKSCVAAARRLTDERAARVAREAGVYLVENCLDERGAIRHLCGPDGAFGLLEDQILAVGALFDLAESSGEQRFAAAARTAMGLPEDQLFDAERQAFADRPVALSVEESRQRPIIPYRDSPHPAGNALAAELYARLGNIDRARMLLKGKRLAEAPGRSHSGCARIAMRLTDGENWGMPPR